MLAGTASPFEILPAIDLVGGRVVRLRQGDFAQVDVVGEEPVDVAAAFAAAGARWLHVVDLDGARVGRRQHAAEIERIVGSLPGSVAVEVAGGLRSEASVREVLASGAQRAVLGTRALADPAMVARLVSRHGADRIAVAIDVRAGLAIGEGWRAGIEGQPFADAIGRLIDAGVSTFEVTTIERDGMLAGPDLELLASSVALGARVIASAGIRSVQDLAAVRAIGCVGAIVGRALYAGSLTLAEALATTR